MKLKLIDQWRSFWRFWSVRLTAAGALILGYITVSPEAITATWNMLPPDLKALLPPNLTMWISVGLIVLGIFARVVKQEKIPKAPNEI